MADTTYGMVEVIACPAEHVASVLAVMNENGLRRDCFGLRDETVLVLCDGYEDHDMRCGTTDDIDGALSELDGVAFRASEDPKYEWLGEVHYRLPDGRGFSGSSDADLQVVLTEGEYRRMAESADDAGLHTSLDTHFGVGLLDEWRRLYREVSARPEHERTLRPA